MSEGTPSTIEAYFAETPDGYVFYPHRWAKGIRVTSGERDEIIRKWENRYKDDDAGCSIAIGAVICIAVVGLLVLWNLSDAVLAASMTALVIGFLIHQRHRSRQLYGKILQRPRTEPRRDSVEFDIALARAYGPYYPLLIFVFLGHALISGSRLADRFSILDAAFFLLMMLSALYLGRMYFRARHAGTKADS